VGNKQAAATLTKLSITATETGKQLRLTVPKSTPAGLVTVELMKAGKAFHEAQLIRLAQGHTPEDAMKVIAAEGSPSPGSTSGTSPTPPGSTAVQNRSPSSISAKRGKYALLYFVSDRKGGPPHVAQGMVAEITVR
jgi:hypothetical protein